MLLAYNHIITETRRVVNTEILAPARNGEMVFIAMEELVAGGIFKRYSKLSVVSKVVI